MKREQTVNLNEQDYTGVVALATSPAGEFFFAAVFNGAIPLMEYEDPNPIYIGRVKKEDEDTIVLEEAIPVPPKNMLNVYHETNYSPLDCLRGLWFELKTLEPGMLSNIQVPIKIVRKRMHLYED